MCGLYTTNGRMSPIFTGYVTDTSLGSTPYMATNRTESGHVTSV
jgi:hypothetical protein